MVTTKLGGVRTIARALRARRCRRCAPRRWMSGVVEPELARRRLAISASGRLQVLGDVDGERLQRRHVDDARDAGDVGSPASCARYRRSMHTRNPASVLPEPVGAAISVSVPAAMCGQPSRWGAVGPSGKRRRNHSATAGWNPSSVPGSPTGAAGVGNSSGEARAAIRPILARGCDAHDRSAAGRNVGGRPHLACWNQRVGTTFGQEISIEAAGSGRYHGWLSDEWCAPTVPQGGLVVAVGPRIARGTARSSGDVTQCVARIPRACAHTRPEVHQPKRGRSAVPCETRVEDPTEP